MAVRDGRERSSQSTDGQPSHPSSSVSLLEVEPELGPLLAREEVDHARRFFLPARTVTSGTDVVGTLKDADAFGAIVLDGLLLHGARIDERPTLRLVEPGDVVPVTGGSPALPLATVSVRAATRSRIVLLDGRLLVATQRWPQLTALMYSRAVASSDRLATQLAISHLSRVDERLMALMWLLADTWGRVTSSGIRLPLALTHDTLGEMVGARRPTVTIALKELAERGSLISQDEGWLILDPPPERRAVEPEPARLIDAPRREMACVPPAEPQPQDGRLAQLQAELDRLRHNHALATATAQDLAAQSRWLRARTLDLIFDAHLLTDVTDQARASTASAANPPGGRLAGLGQK